MPKTIDKQTLEALLATSTKAEIAARFGITTKSVTRLVKQYGLPNVRPTQSEETRRRRAESVKAAHRRDPGLTVRKVKGLKAHHEKIQGKHWEDSYPPEKVSQMKLQASLSRRGKPVKRKPRETPKLCALCGSLVESGKGKKLQSYCKACMSIYFKAYYGQRKEHYKTLNNEGRRRRVAIWKDYLSELKSRACQDCGINYPTYCMDFDHLDPKSKVASIPEIIRSNASSERILAEIGKTEVVCANCHRAREYERYLRAGKPPVHLSPRQRKNREIIEQAKRRPCHDCGGEFSIWQMDFDHVNGHKVGGVGRLALSQTTEILIAEIEKCEVVCAICHRLRTFSKKKA